MKSWENEFLDFCKGMWFDNIVERSDWQQDPLSFDSYVDINKEWLKQQHTEYKIKKMRRLDEWT